jgi:hypothetical protein
MLPICTFSQIAHGTAIAIVRTDRQIVIAADSRVVEGDTDNRLQDICKIHSSGEWYFSLLNVNYTRDFDVSRIVDKTLASDKGDLATKVTMIVRELKPILKSALKSDADLRRFAATRSSLVEIIIYGYEQKILKFWHIAFSIQKTAISVR